MVITSMNNNNNFKNAFSLFEAFVVMLIVSIFVALMANTVAHKPKEKIASEAHGRFECYYENNQLYQQMFTEKSSTGRVSGVTRSIDTDGNSDTPNVNVQVCEFIPPSYAKYLIIDAVGGGAGGSDAGGASEGQFVSTFYASIERKYYILIGAGGNRAMGSSGAENGETTVIYGVEASGNTNAMITAAGGKAVSTLENTTLDDVLACSISEWCTQDAFDCNITPTCQVTNGQLEVSFCRNKGSYVTVPIEYKVKKKDSEDIEMGNPRYVVNNLYTTQKNANTWVYHDISQFSDYNTTDLDPTEWYRTNRPGGWAPDINDTSMPSMYTMELLMNTSAEGDAANESNLHRIIDSLQYTSKMKDAHVGRGGGKNQNGLAGGALFLW